MLGIISVLSAFISGLKQTQLESARCRNGAALGPAYVKLSNDFFNHASGQYAGQTNIKAL